MSASNQTKTVVMTVSVVMALILGKAAYSYVTHRIAEKEMGIAEATSHLQNLQNPKGAYIFLSEEAEMRAALERANLSLSDINLTEEKIEELKVTAYRSTAVSHIKWMQAQPLIAVTYMASNTKLYLDYVGESIEDHGLTETEFTEIRECGFTTLANRISRFNASKDTNKYLWEADYEELSSYLTHRDENQLSTDASIMLMDLTEYWAAGDPPCFPKPPTN